jgi:hypothetical protein
MADEWQSIKDRESLRLSPDVAKPNTVRSLDDIKITISELDPSRNTPSDDIDVTTLMEAPGLAPNTRYKVTAKTKSKSKREYLIEGLDLVKKSTNEMVEEQTSTIVNGIEVKPARMIDRLSMKAWVDNLISHWLGARRDGVLITWTLEDGYRYNYDIYEHRLTRIKI